MSPTVDVLIVTALPLERDAAKEALSVGVDGLRVDAWTKVEDSVAPYLLGTLAKEGGPSFRVALARPTRMGATSTLPVATTLVERLKPRCLAMTGVCAGNPSDVALGDVIVAEFAFTCDEGKRTEAGFESDQRQSHITEPWLRAAQELDSSGLPSHGIATSKDAEFWLLERLYSGADPRKHPARSRYFPVGRWKETVQDLEKRNLICRVGDALEIQEAGQEMVRQSLVYDVDPPTQLPFQIFAGPMASGNVVVKDGVTWEALKQSGARAVIGLEMEAAAIGSLARTSGLEAWAVVKGVMDYADPKKDDRYKPFAARAAAEVFIRLVTRAMPNNIAETFEPVSAIRVRIPSLRISFADTGTSEVALELSQSPPHIAAKTLDEIKRQTPLLAVSAIQDRPSSAWRRFPGFVPPASEWSREETEGYNGWVEHYYSSWTQYRNALAEWALTNQKIFDVSLVLTNDGSAPANDIDVEILFSEEVTLFDEGEGPPRPAAPKPPPFQPLPPGTGFATPMEPDPVSIAPLFPKSTVINAKERRVDFHREKLKHNHSVGIKTFRILFDHTRDSETFSAEYTITSDEIRLPITGTLKFDISLRPVD